MFTFSFAYADETCGNGYTLISTDDIAYSSIFPTRAGGCDAGYQAYTSNYDIIHPAPSESTINCGVGYYYNNGTCVAYTAGSCASGYVDETPAVSANSFDATYMGGCMAGYSEMVTRQYVGYVVSSANPRCGAGYYPTTNGCVAYPTDNCPNNYYAFTPATTFVRGSGESECPTNYSFYDDTDYCRRWLGPNMAELCIPQSVCTGAAKTLRISTGIILPLYGEKLTSPSINLGFSDGTICYVNLAVGNANNAINVKYNNTTYHAVE